MSTFLLCFQQLYIHLEPCAVPENIHTCHGWSIGNSEGEGCEKSIFKESLKSDNWNFQRTWKGRRESKKPSMIGVWIISGRIQWRDITLILDLWPELYLRQFPELGLLFSRGRFNTVNIIKTKWSS